MSNQQQQLQHLQHQELQQQQQQNPSGPPQAVPEPGALSHFCQTTSLHGWKFLLQRNWGLATGWALVVLASVGVAAFFLSNSVKDFLSSTVQTTQDTSRGSLENVFFPSVTLCNINQGRASLFRQVGLSQNETLLLLVLRQAYMGTREPLSPADLSAVRLIFASQEVVSKGQITDFMVRNTAYREEALGHADRAKQSWMVEANESYIAEAGWHFKTLAVQESGENFILRASYRRMSKDTTTYTSLLPFFGTDYGLCTLIKPQITFDPKLKDVPFEALMTNYTKTIKPGIQLGKDNGLSILLDTEVYDYGFSPQRGEGFKLAIHHHMDQPIMALSDIDLSPGFVTQLSVTPTLTLTTDDAKNRFEPEERMCYYDEEFRFKYLPPELYRYGLSNCLFAATYDRILQECACVPFFHTMAYDDFPRVCAGVSLLCMNNILRDIGSHNSVEDVNGRKKICYPPCKDQSNRMAVTTSVFPNLNTFTLGPEFCTLFNKLAVTCKSSKGVTLNERYENLCHLIKQKESVPRYCPENLREETEAQSYLSSKHQNQLVKDQALVNALYRYARENLALVNIYIKDPAVTQIKRDQRIPLIWFIANIGGILGLTMGCSLVTIFEVLHHVLIIFFKTSKISVVRINQTVSKKQQLRATAAATITAFRTPDFMQRRRNAEKRATSSEEANSCPRQEDVSPSTRAVQLLPSTSADRGDGDKGCDGRSLEENQLMIPPLRADEIEAS